MLWESEHERKRTGINDELRKIRKGGVGEAWLKDILDKTYSMIGNGLRQRLDSISISRSHMLLVLFLLGGQPGKLLALEC